jgi:DegV family protein with EDD domain
MRIVTDSAADIPAQELASLDVFEAPLYIHFPEGEVKSSEIAADDFYNRLEAMRPEIPTTAQPSGGDFAVIYREVAKTDPRILSLHISSGLSGTHNAAEVGAAEARPEAETTVWDTRTLSGGERFQVLSAAAGARAGQPLPQILARLAELRDATEVVYTLETLEYLARGGRIGRVQAVAGALLNLKPIIRVDRADGKYSTVAKARSIPKALAMIADHLHGLYGDTPVWVTVLHGRAPDQAAVLAAELPRRLNVAKLETMRISPVLGVHTGPGIIGCAVVPMKLMPEAMAG